MVEFQPSKLAIRVRFPLPAPPNSKFYNLLFFYAFLYRLKIASYMENTILCYPVNLCVFLYFFYNSFYKGKIVEKM